MSGYISDQRTEAPVFLCNILLLPTDTDQLSSPLFLQLVCFCCQKSKYSHLALTLTPNLLVRTPKQPGRVLQGGAASSATPHHSSSL